jgi:AcrR family transcriptional regulator
MVGDVLQSQRGLSDDQLTTDRQRQRRARILDAAVEVAGAGGYDLVHMRDIAGRAEVSLATLYHHFPSKVHLLVRALERELLRFDYDLGEELSGVLDPFARLRVVVRRLIEAMERSRRVSDALTQAYVASTVVASAEAEAIRVVTTDIFVQLISDGSATDLHLHAIALIIDVWTAELLALAQCRRTHVELHRQLNTVIDLLERAYRRDRLPV